MQNILIINPFGIGDVLFTTPLISVLRNNYPDAVIAYMCNYRVKDIVETNPDINQVFVFDRGNQRQLWKESKKEAINSFLGIIKEVKKYKFEVVIDLSLKCDYSFVLWLLGVKRRIGFNFKKRGKFLTDKLQLDGFSKKHVCEYYLDIARYLNLKITDNDKQLKLITAKSDCEFANNFIETTGLKFNDKLIAVFPGGGGSYGKNAYFKRWDIAKFAQICNKLYKKYNQKILLLSSPDEAEMLSAVRAIVGDMVINSPKTTIRQMAALMAKCDLVVCNDGGPLHMAVSQGISTVSIFGGVDPKVYGPYPKTRQHIIIVNERLSCRPCYKGFKFPECDNRKCLTEVSVDEVFEAVVNLIKV